MSDLHELHVWLLKIQGSTDVTLVLESTNSIGLLRDATFHGDTSAVDEDRLLQACYEGCIHAGESFTLDGHDELIIEVHCVGFFTTEITVALGEEQPC